MIGRSFPFGIAYFLRAIPPGKDRWRHSHHVLLYHGPENKSPTQLGTWRFERHLLSHLSIWYMLNFQRYMVYKFPRCYISLYFGAFFSVPFPRVSKDIFCSFPSPKPHHPQPRWSSNIWPQRATSSSATATFFRGARPQVIGETTKDPILGCPVGSMSCWKLGSNASKWLITYLVITYLVNGLCISRDHRSKQIHQKKTSKIWSQFTNISQHQIFMAQDWEVRNFPSKKHPKTTISPLKRSISPSFLPNKLGKAFWNACPVSLI